MDPFLIEQIKESKVIAVVRGSSSAKVLKTVNALKQGGVNIIEITFTMADPIGVIKRLSSQKDILLGAGTVLGLKQAEEAVQNGAKFIVSPCTVKEVLKFCLNNNILCMPGIFTPTEAFNAISAGAKILKLFPGSVVGPEYIKALKGPFPDIEIVPTGGVSLSNAKDWFKAGAIAVGMGSNLIPKEAVEKENYAEITKRAKDFVKEIKNI